MSISDVFAATRSLLFLNPEPADYLMPQPEFDVPEMGNVVFFRVPSGIEFEGIVVEYDAVADMVFVLFYTVVGESLAWLPTSDVVVVLQ